LHVFTPATVVAHVSTVLAGGGCVVIVEDDPSSFVTV
jgi:hypothetical protein